MSQPQDLIFALDIGTRSVVGLVADHLQDGKLQVVATEVQEHTTRAMLDGQIHDVVEVAEIIRRVKERLEEKVGPLKKVAVAAAGRALKTVRTRVDRELVNNQRLTKEDVMALELTAVQQAEKQLQDITPDAARYHCVGYTVIHYLLDDSQIGSLVDQWGLQASVEIIATFLPRVVIDSLQIALERAGLEMAALTLEPIAAINALIPPTMRKLNLALVDIGAGTSDIALTAEGTVTAYGMVPVAGDEITEALSQKYLLDFPVAEEVKRKLLAHEIVTYTDVLGMPYEVPAREITESIFEEVTHLAQMIGREIKNLNQRGPQAVMLIGGGSQTPMLPALLAAELGLPKERVVIRGTDAIQQLAAQHDSLQGPQAVTPVGIALAAILTPVSSVAVRVNGLQHRLFEFRQITVGDCLLAADVDIRKLHGRPGLALTIEVNGKMKVLRGTHGTPAELLLNGQPAKLDDTVQHGDELEVIGGTSGVDASGTVSDVLDPHPPLVVYRGAKRFSLPPLIFMNGQSVAPETPLVDRARITSTSPQVMRDVLTLLDLPEEIGEVLANPPQLTVTVDGHTVYLPYDKYRLLLNEETAYLDTPIHSDDVIDYDELQPPVYQVRYFYDESLHPLQSVNVICNGVPYTIEGPRPPIYRNGEKCLLDDLVLDGDFLHFATAPYNANPLESNWQPVLSDLFRYIAIEKERPPHCIELVLTVNHQPAAFTTPLPPGAIVTMEWK